MTLKKEYTDTREAVRTALAIQDAANIGPVIREWAAMQAVIYEAVHQDPSQFTTRNHPLQILMLSKVVSLMSVDASCIGGVTRGEIAGEYVDLFRHAYHWACERHLKENGNE